MVYLALYPVWLILPVLTSVLTTHPDCREAYPYPDIEVPYGNTTISITLYQALLIHFGNPKTAMMGSTVQKPGFDLIERLCFFCFGLEVILRFLCCPRVLNLFKSPLFYIDCIVLTTSSITFGIEMDKTYEKHFWLYNVCKCSLVIRLFRLMHLARHIGGLRVLILAIRASVKELSLLLISLLSVAIFFAAVVYYAEFEKPDSFAHMPIAIWWSIVTMTTVGYGDFIPSTVTGYIVGALCAMTGVLIISMPIAVIAANFTEFYNLNRIRVEKERLSASSYRKDNVSGLVHKTNKIASISGNPSQP